MSRRVTTPTRARLLVVALAAALPAVFACFAVRATAAPAPFLLTFEGEHVADDTLPAALRHDGRFTASAPFCSAGRAYDVRHSTDEGGFLSVLRIHTCDDGSGSFTADMPTVRGEHGGSGTWSIVEGTGRYATMRGMGTYIGTRLSGDPDVFATIVYRTNWQGVVDFDADPPTIETFTARPRKLRLRLRTYALQVGLAVRDSSAPVSYTVDVRAGRAPLAFKRGTTASGQAAVTIRIRPPRGARSASVALTARDALGNETSASQTVALR
jgi:hypothetical protein